MNSNAATSDLDHAEAPPRRRHRGLMWTGGTFAVLALAAAILAAVWDWNWFRGPLAGLASSRMHRPVAIGGDLKVHLFSWQPSASVSGVRIGAPAWAGGGDMANIGRIALQI
ncbi:MAG TPA: AsmA family protein, partial [Phenylobacterium sp.]